MLCLIRFFDVVNNHLRLSHNLFKVLFQILMSWNCLYLLKVLWQKMQILQIDSLLNNPHSHKIWMNSYICDWFYLRSKFDFYHTRGSLVFATVLVVFLFSNYLAQNYHQICGWENGRILPYFFAYSFEEMWIKWWKLIKIW